MATEKDCEQDALIRENAERISRNEEAIKRQTEALEQIRDHYYPPPEGILKKITGYFVKAVCLVVAYLGIAETVDWLWNVRESEAKAAQYADMARRLFMEEGNATAAMACYEKAISFNSNESEYVTALSFMKGMAMSADFVDNDRPLTDAEQTCVDAALSEAVILRELEPENPMPYVLMAQAYSLSGENAAATAAVERAVACAPAVAPLRVTACAIQFFAGHPDIARAHLDEARRLNASLPLAGVWDGMLKLYVDRDAAAAANCLREQARRSPRLPVVHALLARALLAADKPDLPAVRASFQKALVLDARLSNAMLGMAETYEREGNLVLARLWLDRAIAMKSGYLPALIARARIAAKLGDCEAALSDLDAAVSLVPFRAEHYKLRADVHDKLGNSAKAKSDRETAAALSR